MKNSIDGFEQVARETYGHVLLSINWNFFGRTLEIVTGGTTGVKLKLQGVHSCTFRQSVTGPEDLGVGEDCAIDFLDMVQEHPLIEQFLENKIHYLTNGVIYDSEWHQSDSPEFRRPLYLSLLCSDGHLDVIFETWQASH